VESFAGPALVAILEIAGGARAALVLPDEKGTLGAVVARTASGETIPPSTFVVSQGEVHGGRYDIGCWGIG